MAYIEINGCEFDSFPRTKEVRCIVFFVDGQDGRLEEPSLRVRHVPCLQEAAAALNSFQEQRQQRLLLVLRNEAEAMASKELQSLLVKARRHLFSELPVGGSCS